MAFPTIRRAFRRDVFYHPPITFSDVPLNNLQDEAPPGCFPLSPARGTPEGGGLVGAGQQAFVKQAANLPLQVAPRPIALHRFGFIELAGGIIFHPHQSAVV